MPVQEQFRNVFSSTLAFYKPLLLLFPLYFVRVTLITVHVTNCAVNLAVKGTTLQVQKIQGDCTAAEQPQTSCCTCTAINPDLLAANSA